MNHLLFLPGKKNILKLICGCALAAGLVTGCAKEEVLPEDPVTPPVTNTSDFRWNAGAATIVADSAVCYSQITTLFAYKSGTLSTVEINLSDIVAGTYNISSTSGNSLIYEENSISHTASSGTVQISSNSNGKLSGKFGASFATGTITTISGQFTDMRIK